MYRQADPDEKRSHPADEAEVDEKWRAAVPVYVSSPCMSLPVHPVEGRACSSGAWNQKGSILDSCRCMLKKRVSDWMVE